MSIPLSFLYIIIGAAATFYLHYLHLKDGNRSDDDGIFCVMIGVFWPVAAPFALAIHFSENIYWRK